MNYKFEILAADITAQQAEKMMEKFVEAVEALGLEICATAYPVDDDGNRIVSSRLAREGGE